MSKDKKNIQTESCHGCFGRGWVDSKAKGAQLCPVCGGSGKKKKELPFPERIPWKPLPIPEPNPNPWINPYREPVPRPLPVRPTYWCGNEVWVHKRVRR